MGIEVSSQDFSGAGSFGESSFDTSSEQSIADQYQATDLSKSTIEPAQRIMDNADFSGNQFQVERIFQQLENVLSDGILSVEELEAQPELSQLIREDLGYASIKAFVFAHASKTDQWADINDSVDLTSDPKAAENIEAIWASITGVLNNKGPIGLHFNKLPPVPAQDTFVQFDLGNGRQVTFDGMNAGALANEFVKVYNRSDLFQESLHAVMDRQGGQYAFHRIPLPRAITGFNAGGIEGELNGSGIFIQSAPPPDEAPPNVLSTIIHELGHELHTNEHNHSEIDTGEAHSREHVLYIGGVVNQLENKGLDTKIDIDDGDYSDDTLIFDKSFADEDSPFKNSIAIKSESMQHLHYEKLYHELKKSINQEDYSMAEKIFNLVEAQESVTLEFRNIMTMSKNTSTYNVRELIFQELLLSSDSDDLYNTDIGNEGGKQILGEFFNYLVSNDPSLESTIAEAAIDIYFDLDIELPGYTPANGNTFFANIDKPVVEKEERVIEMKEEQGE